MKFKIIVIGSGYGGKTIAQFIALRDAFAKTGEVIEFKTCSGLTCMPLRIDELMGRLPKPTTKGKGPRNRWGKLK